MDRSAEISQKMSKVRWVDILKGLLILLVIFGHAVQGLAADATLEANPQYQGIVVVKDTIYSFHMPAFFVVSGFFAGGLWQKDLRRQIMSKLRRLVRPYFVWGFITACAMQLMLRFTNRGEGLVDFLWSPIVPFSQFWYLYVLFFVFLLHCGLSAALRQHADRVLLGLSVVLFAVQPVVPDVWILRDLCNYALYYALGIFVFDPINTFATGTGGVLPLVSRDARGGTSPVSRKNEAGVLSIPLMQRGMPLLFQRFCSFCAAAAGFGATCGASVLLARTNGVVAVVLERFGRESMALYVTHLLAVQGLRIVLVRFLHVDNLWLVALAASALGCALCWAFILLAKKTRLYSYLF